MGRSTFTRTAFAAAHTAYVPTRGPATRRAQEEIRRTGKLNELVDPAGFGVIRRSLLRFEERPDGLQELTIGTSMPIETRLDTTGSMGDNVDRALKVLPDLYDLCSGVLPDYDVHVAIGIFGDCMDNFILCRPQFEMLAEKIVEQLTLMNPEHGGAGNGGEDPHYGLFGGAYLTAAYINRIGLKGYDFTISDEPARAQLSEQQLIRVYGSDVFDKVKANGFDIDRNDLPSTKEVVQDLLMRAHGFFLEVDNRYNAHGFWTDVFGPERVILLPRIELLPQVQAIIIGLTEGTLSLDHVGDFLQEFKVSAAEAKNIQRSVANIPIGAQADLREGIRVPQKGDLFTDKTDLWPIDPSDAPVLVPAATATEQAEGPSWL